MLRMGGKSRNSSLNVLLILALPEVVMFLQETYLEYLFMPGRFTNAAIQKALQVSERQFGMLSVHPGCEAAGFLGAPASCVFTESPWSTAATLCPQPEAKPGIQMTIGLFFFPW